MATPEPIAEPNEKTDEPWKPPPRPGLPGIGYDELGAEMAPNARVWKKYVEESDRMDQELVDGWNKYAVNPWEYATSSNRILWDSLIQNVGHHIEFVIESSKDLKPDYSQASAETLRIMSQTLSAIARGTPLNDSEANAPETADFTPSSSAIAVNTLWFLSLGLSVAVSLIAILAKEWCHSFMAGRVGSMLRQARLRQRRWDGIEQWKMKEILYVLPLLMHIALLLFAVGLSLYLWDIDMRVALPVVITTSLAALFYLITVSLPLFFRFCPYTTALARFLYPYWLGFLANRHTLDAIGALVASPGWISHVCMRAKQTIKRRVRSMTQCGLKDDIEATANLQAETSPFSFRYKIEQAQYRIRNWVESMRAVFSTDRSQLVENHTPMDNVTSSMIAWMVVNCEDSRSVDMALQALAGAYLPLPRLPLWERGVVDTLCQRLVQCTGVLAQRRNLGLQAANDALLDDASLFSRSLNFLTAYIAGEGLDMTEESKPCFTVRGNSGLGTTLQNVSQRARSLNRYKLDEILNYAWDQPTPRYELVAYELNNIPAKASVNMWDTMEGYRNQCQKQQELGQHIASGKVSGLPSSAVVALIHGITKTYLYNTSQSPKPLLDLLGYLEAQSDSNPEYIGSLAIGLTVVGLLAGSYRGEVNKADKTLTNDARLGLAREAYTNLAAKGPDFRQSQTLLRFGLLALLEHKTDCVWTFSTAEVELIKSHLGRLLVRASYHDVLPDILPASFGYGDHLVQILSRLLDDMSPDKELGLNPELVSSALLRIEAVLSRVRYTGAGHRVVPLLTQHFSSTGSAQLKQLCLRGVKHSLEGGPDQLDFVLDSLVQTGLLTQVLEVTTSAHDDQIMVPYCMEFLWIAGRGLLYLTDEGNPESRRSVARSLLESLDNQFKTSATEGGLPDNRDEMGLANLWLAKIDELCHSDPQSVLDSNLLSAMIVFYEYEPSADIKPRTTELPSAFDDTWTWLQILRYWEKICKEAIENQAKDSAPPGEPTHTIPSVERYAGESGLCLDIHDWSI